LSSYTSVSGRSRYLEPIPDWTPSTANPRRFFQSSLPVWLHKFMSAVAAYTQPLPPSPAKGEKARDFREATGSVMSSQEAMAARTLAFTLIIWTSSTASERVSSAIVTINGRWASKYRCISTSPVLGSIASSDEVEALVRLAISSARSGGATNHPALFARYWEIALIKP